jgi:acyl carrier protein|tara:strand:+ start:1554 stop:1781 length:228 start_codon:yes stop_codon:yes gene_type:complete
MIKLKKEIIDILKNVFKDTKVTINSNINNVKNWDSLNHVNLVSEISKKYSIKISFFEMINVNSVKDLIKLVKKKL